MAFRLLHIICHTLKKYLSKESNTVHHHGDGMLVKHFSDVLSNGVSYEYEAPDMYIEYEDEIWIIEHFEIDCYKRTKKGSSLRVEQSRIDREIEDINPTKEIVTYHKTINASLSYDDFIRNVKLSFELHYGKIASYKKLENE